MPENADLSSPKQTLNVEVTDATSEIKFFKVKIDAEEPYDYTDETGSSTIILEDLKPGYHSFVIEAFDMAGNSIVGTFAFTVLAFDKPFFTEIPSEINGEVIPVIKGVTRPDSLVEISLSKIGSEPTIYTINSDSSGNFVFIPEGTFDLGVYELSAQATDSQGAKSESSDIMRIAVQKTGFLRIGSMMVSVLSVVIPLVVLGAALVMGIWYLLLYFSRFRKKVRVESLEALDILRHEFSNLQIILKDQESVMKDSRKTKKLTIAEGEMVRVMDQALMKSKQRVEKEIDDITDLAGQETN